jgi:hypothetical protein
MKTCSVQGCNAANYSYGWCVKHYQRWRRHGSITGGGPPRCTRGHPEEFIRTKLHLATEDACLIWPFGKTRHGYALGRPKGQKGSRLVHHIACEMRHGPPPSTKHYAIHSCGKGHEGCVNPWHLRWGTQVENMADALLHGHRLRGEQCSQTRLRETDVREIRALRGLMTQRAIARKFGIHQVSVSMIQLGKNWAWLT